ncbi:MAG: hypothetical protein WBP81_23970, partial [Solirubrobacteraceae bacterium]
MLARFAIVAAPADVLIVIVLLLWLVIAAVILSLLDWFRGPEIRSDRDRVGGHGGSDRSSGIRIQTRG